MKKIQGLRGEGRGRERSHYLQVSVDDGRLALVQAGHGLTGVAEDVKDLGLAEAHVQPLVHLLHHLTRCRREREHISLVQPGIPTPASVFTVLTLFHSVFQLE